MITTTRTLSLNTKKELAKENLETLNKNFMAILSKTKMDDLFETGLELGNTLMVEL